MPVGKTRYLFEAKTPESGRRLRQRGVCWLVRSALDSYSSFYAFVRGADQCEVAGVVVGVNIDEYTSLEPSVLGYSGITIIQLLVQLHDN